MKKILIIFLFSPFSLLFAQNDKLIAKINLFAVQEKLRNVSKELNVFTAKNQAENNGVDLLLPMADGSNMSFKVIESPLMSDELAKRFPEIKTYRAFGNSNASGLFTVAPSGVYGLFFTEKGNVIIAPKDILQNDHEVFYQNDLLTDGKCEVGEEQLNILGKNLKVKSIQSYSNGSTLRTYRMSIVTTGEFFTNNGGTQSTAQAAIVAMVNSLKAVYEKEVSVSFSLVSTKIYEDANTDPFNPNGSTKALDAAIAFGSLASSDPANFALGLYDVGHVIHHSPGGGGVAYMSSPCNNSNLSGSISPIKAGGWSGGTTSSLTTFIHEVGHQFSAGHTFNSVNSACNGNIMTGSAYEPGSGSTYMSYSGSCSPDNISGIESRTYFHTNSLESIISYSTNSGTCSVNTATGNTAPVVNANPNSRTLTIPKGTPFALDGSGTDANGATILFNWEQYNLGTTRGGAAAAQNSTDSPIFRTFAPSASGNVRMFPTLSTILAGSIPGNDEALPQVARTLTMRLTGRDNNAGGGGVHCASINIVVDNSGPFLITSQNTNTYWVQASTKTITWSVNGTNAAPLNCTNVVILFSSDNGVTFPTVLAANTPNDGSQSITVPSITTAQGRIKIVPINTNLIFFDTNNAPINVVSALPSCAAETLNLTPTSTVSALAGDPALNLNLFSYTAVINVSKTTATTDPTMPLIGYNGSGCTIPYSNIMYYKTYTFRVSASGSYTFTIQAPVSSKSINLFTGNFAGGCTNWIGGSIDMNSSPVCGSTITALLSANTNYTMTVSSTINISSTSTVNINFSGAGSIWQPIPAENSFYSVNYVVVNTTTNTIKAIQSTPNLANSTTFPSGNYAVYGISYLTENTDFTGFINQPFSNLQSAISGSSICAKFSNNSVTVNITNNCQNALSLSGTATAGLQNANQTLTSTQVINSGVNVTYRAANSITLSPQTGSGFVAANGSVFKAEIGGCN